MEIKGECTKWVIFCSSSARAASASDPDNRVLASKRCVCSKGSASTTWLAVYDVSAQVIAQRPSALRSSRSTPARGRISAPNDSAHAAPAP